MASDRRTVRAARRPAVLVLACALALLPQRAPAQAQADEAALKLAYLYNFAQFVSWPAESFADAQAPLVLCVAGRDPWGPMLDRLGGRVVAGHTLRVARPRGVSEARGCHLLYVDDVAGQAWLLAALAEAPVLTVASQADAEAAAPPPATIGFVRRGERLGWAVNLELLRKARLKLSSKLLEMAVRLHDGERAP